MAVLSPTAVSVATTATLIRQSTGGSSQVPEGVLIYNDGANDVFIGGPAVTTATGIPVAAGSFSPGISLLAGEAIYGIVAAATEDVKILVVGA